MPTTNRSDLLYKVFNKNFPLNANTCSMVLGGSGSGKSFFSYNILMRIYLDNFDIQHLFVCSRSATCDETLRRSLDELEEEYPYLTIEFCSPSELYKNCQKYRLSAMKAEMLNKMVKLQNYAQLTKFVEKDIQKNLESVGQFVTIMEGMYLFSSDLITLLDPASYHIVRKNVGKKHRDDSSEDSEEMYVSSDGLESDELSPELIDINFCISDTGLAINNNVFSRESTKPIITVDYQHKDQLPKEEERRQIESGIFDFIKNTILIPRQEILKFGSAYQPILAIVDDYAGTEEFMNSHSTLTQMVLLRRHLHLSIFILTQTITGINTDIRRNTNTFHLLPSISRADIDLIALRLPSNMDKKDLREIYEEGCKNEDRNQNLVSLFTVFPNHKIITGAPKCILEYYERAKK